MSISKKIVFLIITTHIPLQGLPFNRGNKHIVSKTLLYYAFHKFRNNPLSNKTTAVKYKDDLCPNILDTGHNTNARLPTIKIINKKKLSVDTGMDSKHVDSDDNANWQLYSHFID